MAGLEKTMTNIQSEVSSLKVRADLAETKLREMDTGLQFANAEVEDLKTQSRNNQKKYRIPKRATSSLSGGLQPQREFTIFWPS